MAGVDALDNIGATADGAAAQGATATHRQRLADAIAAFRPLVSTPRTQLVAGAATTATLRKLVKGLRATFARLDTRVDNLRDELPALATRYEQAREIVDAGHGPKIPPPPSPPSATRSPGCQCGGRGFLLRRLFPA